jgi:hypothetical protein
MVPILLMPFAPFQPPNPALGGPATVLPPGREQDDDFVGVLKKNIPNKLALMGFS